MTTIDVRPGTISIDHPAALVAGKRVVSPTLVGRSAELATLVLVVIDVLAVVCVEGEAGVGKTRLVAELFGAAEVAGRQLGYTRRWLSAWPWWPGSGTRRVTRPGPWRRWTTPGAPG
jgi:hypothetical protein